MAVKKETPQEQTPRGGRMVRIRVPRLPHEPDNKQVIYVGHNFKNYRVKRGEDVWVPEGVAHRIEQAEQALEYSDRAAMQMAQK